MLSGLLPPTTEKDYKHKSAATLISKEKMVDGSHSGHMSNADGSHSGHYAPNKDGSHSGHFGPNADGSHSGHMGPNADGSHSGHYGPKVDGSHSGHMSVVDGSHSGHFGPNVDGSHSGHMSVVDGSHSGHYSLEDGSHSGHMASTASTAPSTTGSFDYEHKTTQELILNWHRVAKPALEVLADEHQQKGGYQDEKRVRILGEIEL